MKWGIEVTIKMKNKRDINTYWVFILIGYEM